MTKRDAKRNACQTVSILIGSYQSCGQDLEHLPEDDYLKIQDALDEIEIEMWRRGRRLKELEAEGSEG